MARHQKPVFGSKQFFAFVLAAFFLSALSSCANSFMEWIVGGKNNSGTAALTIDIPDKMIKSFSPIDDYASFNVTVSGFASAADAYGVELLVNPPAGFTISGHNAKAPAVNGVKTFTVRVDTTPPVTAATQAVISITGLAGMPAAGYYPYTGGPQNVPVQYADGLSEANAIPVTQENIVRSPGESFNGYARSNIASVLHYKQIGNITLPDPAPFSNGNWTPIGNNSAAQFLGSYDGQNNTITNLNISNNTQSQGLFGYIGTGAQVANVRLVGCKVAGDSGTGSVAGNNHGGEIINCSSQGAVTGVNSNTGIGGIVGVNYGRVKKCYSSCAVNGGQNTGGIVGYNGYNGSSYGTVEYCYAGGDVTGNANTGGIAGYIVYGTINNSYSTGNVTGAWHTGGIAGGNDVTGIVQNCYSTGIIKGTGNIGGIIGNMIVGEVLYCAALNQSVILLSGTTFGRAIGNYSGGTTDYNYARQGMDIRNNTAPDFSGGTAKFPLDNTHNDLDGGDLPVSTNAYEAAFRHGTGLSSGGLPSDWGTGTWDFAAVWEWSAAKNRPILRGLAGQ